jgi:hypothetical protein
MGRPKSDKNKRGQLKKSLETALLAKKLNEDFYTDRFTQYLEFYDTKTHLNSQIKFLRECAGSNRTLIDTLTALRQVDKQMMDILNFLGLKPPDEMPPAGDDDEL